MTTKAKPSGVYIALGDITVHKLMTPETEAYVENSTNNYPTTSVVLSAGEWLPANEVPYYVREGVEAGRIPLLKRVTEAVAKRMASEATAGRVLEEQTLAPVAVQSPGDAVSSGPGRVDDVSASGVAEIDGETVIISGDNSGYGQDSPTQNETIVA